MNEPLELYKKAAEIAKIGIWELILEDNKLFWDFVTKKIFETSENFKPTLPKALAFYVPTPSTEPVEQLLKQTIFTGKALSAQFQIKTEKGNLKWVEINSQAEFDGEVCMRLVGTIQDITPQRKLIQTLELNHQKFLTAFDHAPIGMALVSPEGNWIKVNNSLSRLLGYHRDELMTGNFQSITHPDDLEEDLGHVTKLLNKEANTYSMEKRYYHKDGRTLWVQLTVAIVWNTDDTPLYFISQLKDITDTIKHTERLHKERQRLNNVIESTQIGTWEWNIITNKRTNDERCYTMLGYTKAEFTPEHVNDIFKNIHPDDEEQMQHCLNQALTKQTDLYACEYRMLAKDGSWVWMESHGKVIKWSENGKPLVMLGTRQDITKRKLVEEERIKTMSIISDQNKRLINFAHIVSHNLRSHAGNFQMMLELYQLETDEEQRTVMLDLLKQNAENLTETIANLNEVVSFHFDEKKQTKLINLNEQVKKTIVNIQALVEQESASFSIEIDTGLHVNCNPAYLESILLNFFTNAVKYRHPERLPEILVKAVAEGKHTTIIIEDNGLGIDLELHGAKLFGMYKTFHDHADARGIGLFITKNQVDALGGTINVQSEVGKGTTFKISLLN